MGDYAILPAIWAGFAICLCLFQCFARARLTHFHRSGTWLTPTDISQTFFTLLFIAFDLIQVRWLGGRATFVARATELDDFGEIDSLIRPANDDTLLKKRGSIFFLLSYY